MPSHTTRNANRQPMMSSVSNKQKMLMQALTHFFTTTKGGHVVGGAGGRVANPYIDVFLHQVSKGAPISLRVIDWFVTNYSREHDVSYLNTRTGRRFNVHESYKTQLKAYSKRQFDPFCRRNRINFYYRRDAKIQTTVGQMNFFRWALENQVLDYIAANLPAIEKEMRQFVKTQREEKRECVGGGEAVATGGMSRTRRRTARGGGSGSSGSGGSGGGGSGSGSGSSLENGASATAPRRGHIYTHRAPVTVDFS